MIYGFTVVSSMNLICIIVPGWHTITCIQCFMDVVFILGGSVNIILLRSGATPHRTSVRGTHVLPL